MRSRYTSRLPPVGGCISARTRTLAALSTPAAASVGSFRYATAASVSPVHPAPRRRFHALSPGTAYEMRSITGYPPWAYGVRCLLHPDA